MASPTVLPGKHRAALIGGGFIGPVHAEALRRIGVEVAGVLGSSPERAQGMAESLQVGRIYRDLDDLLSDSSVEVVHIASPNAYHFTQSRRCLKAGLHVVCEKPLATTSGETSELKRLSAERPLQVAAVNYNIRYYPLCLEMKARISRGDIGRVLNVSGSYTQDWLLRPTDYNWRVEPDGGTNLRAVADIGTHWMDLTQFILGDHIESVFADLATFFEERRRPAGSREAFQSNKGNDATIPVRITTEDYAAVLLRFGSGTRGTFHVSQTSAGRKNRLFLEINGSDASLAWDSESPNQLWVGRKEKPNQLLERDPALLSPLAAAASHYPGGHAEGFPDTFKQLFLSVYNSVGNKESGPVSYPTFSDGDREVRICEAIVKSASEERWAFVAE